MGRSLISAAAANGPGIDGSPVGAVLADGERRKEVDSLQNECRQRVRALLAQERRVLEGVRDVLLQREELIGDEIEALMAELGEREPIEVPLPDGNGRELGPVVLGLGGNGQQRAQRYGALRSAIRLRGPIVRSPEGSQRRHG